LATGKKESQGREKNYFIKKRRKDQLGHLRKSEKKPIAGFKNGSTVGIAQKDDLCRKSLFWGRPPSNGGGV